MLELVFDELHREKVENTLIYHVLPFSTTKNNHGFFEHIVAAIRCCKNYNKLQHMSDVP